MKKSKFTALDKNDRLFLEVGENGEKRVLFVADVCLRGGVLLEVFCCKKNTKEHESILHVDLDGCCAAPRTPDDRDGGRERIDLGQELWLMIFRYDQEPEQQVRVERLNLEFALPACGRALPAIRVTRWTKGARADARAGGEDEDGGFGEWSVLAGDGAQQVRVICHFVRRTCRESE